MYNKIKNSLQQIITLILISNAVLSAQQITSDQQTSITVTQCYEWSRANFPLIQQLDLIDRTTAYNLSNASTGNLPQVNINGQATYQSEVTALPIQLPNVNIPTQDKDQYKIYGELYQPLSNFSNVQTTKKQIKINGDIKKQQLEIDLYQLKQRVNQLYFGALLIDAKITQLQTIKVELDSAIIKVNAAISNGIATTTDAKLLEVESISISQLIEENETNKLTFAFLLSTLTGQNITSNIHFIKPEIKEVSLNINRPELYLFQLQNQSINLQNKEANNSLIPNIGMFAQFGYGRPALNFLSNEFNSYYIGGLKLHWNISNFYTIKNRKKSLGLAHEMIRLKKETFLLNTQLTQSQQSAEITKYKNLIISDHKIIAIRESILETAQVQLSNGMITTIDYIQFVNNVSKAKQLLHFHEIQLLLSHHNLISTTGN